MAPSAESRCSSLSTLAAISLQHQTVFCLGGRAPLCSRYRAEPAHARGAEANAPRRLDTRLAIAALVLVAAGGAVAALAVGNPFDAEPVPSGSVSAATSAAVPAGTISQTPALAQASVASPSPEPAAATSTPAITPSPRPTPTATPSLYTVQPGDSLTRLAARFGVSLAELAAANQLAPNANLQTGQTLRIPPRGSSSPTPAAP
ncbi:MAG TPA: LysM peptidoglycan-binding domain-containing protein [Dehalococcoidia bacterium]